jgi:hypothetical protein
MNEVIEDAEHPFGSDTTTGYRYINNEGIDEPIGTVTLVHDEGLVMAFNLNPEYHGMGLGRRAFMMGFEKYSASYDIKYIRGSWKYDLEFAHLEHGESTNLTVYKKCLAEGLSQQEAALTTPTGKWASAMGFDKAVILIESEDHVEVDFVKELPPAEPEPEDEFAWLKDF